MALARRVCQCGICENANAPSVCSSCINPRLIEKYKQLRRLSRYRDGLHSRVQARLKAKHEADQQLHWKNVHNDKISKLKERLHDLEIELQRAREELIAKQHDLDARSHFLAVASAQLAKKQVEQLGQPQPDDVRTHILQLTNISSELHQRRRFVFRQLCKIFPLKRTSSSSTGGGRDALRPHHVWTICNVQLPTEDNIRSVGKKALGSSLGYMLQLLQLAAAYLSAPLLHNALIKGSTSKIWQRTSYLESGPYRSEEYPLFIPVHSGTQSEEQTLSEKGSSSLGFSTIDGNLLEPGYISSSNSSGSTEMPLELYKGIRILKRSVGCVSSYGFGQHSQSTPANMDTFHAFAELMMLLSSKEIRGRSRTSENPTNSLSESSLSLTSSMELSRQVRDVRGFRVRNLNMGNSYCIVRGVNQAERVGESVLEEWDVVEHPPLPPPPSHSEDVEHWTRAMFVDARK